MSQGTFIEVYDFALTPEQCNRCIEIFEDSKRRQIPGSFYYEDDLQVHLDSKKDLELAATTFEDDSEISSIILEGLLDPLSKYKEKYESSLSIIGKWSVETNYNVQKYTDETDGFKAWHTEAGGIDTCGRILAWMIYLNTAESGTDFLYYPNVESKQGRCVIWPGSWTHTHRSTPNKGLKYLATGWISFVHDEYQSNQNEV